MSLERLQNRRGQQGSGREEDHPTLQGPSYRSPRGRGRQGSDMEGESTPPSTAPLTTSPGGGDGRGAAGKENLPHPPRALLPQPVQLRRL